MSVWKNALIYCSLRVDFVLAGPTWVSVALYYHYATKYSSVCTSSGSHLYKIYIYESHDAFNYSLYKWFNDVLFTICILPIQYSLQHTFLYICDNRVFPSSCCFRPITLQINSNNTN